LSKVTIVIPVYNVEKYLRECLDSVVNQTYKNIEIICVDDGSTDTSFEILKEYAGRDNRLVIVQQQNQGAAVARNYGLMLATGGYVLFLDSDDIFHLELVEKTLFKAQQFDADIVVYKALSFNTETGKQIALNDGVSKFTKYQYKTFSATDVPNEIFNSFLTAAWNKLFKKEFILNNRIEFQNIKRTNDLYFTNKALILAERIIILDEYLLYYRTEMKSNLQASNDKSPLAFYEALCELKCFLENKKLYLRVEKSFLNMALEIIFYNLNSFRKEETRNLVINKFREEGFKKLGISTYKNLRELNYLGYLQYKAIKSNRDKIIIDLLYVLFKFVQYYKLFGIKKTMKKVLVKL